MTQTGKLTLRQAAETVECSTATVSKALKNGALSGDKLEDGSFSIDPAELMRWNETRSQRGKRSQTQTAANTTKNTPENSVLQARLEVTEGRLADAQATIDDLRNRLDAEQEERRNLSARLLPAPEQATTPPEKPRGLLRRLFG